MTNAEFEALLQDQAKTIAKDISWSEDEDHSPAVEFRVEVENAQSVPLFIRGSFNRLAETLSFAVIHRGVGRIYALDMGKDHHNPSCTFTGRLHKHRWTETFRDKDAYVPPDITAPASDPVTVWHQFCAEFNLTHTGTMHAPPPTQQSII